MKGRRKRKFSSAAGAEPAGGAPWAGRRGSTAAGAPASAVASGAAAATLRLRRLGRRSTGWSGLVGPRGGGGAAGVVKPTGLRDPGQVLAIVGTAPQNRPRAGQPQESDRKGQAAMERPRGLDGQDLANTVLPGN